MTEDPCKSLDAPMLRQETPLFAIPAPKIKRRGPEQ